MITKVDHESSPKMIMKKVDHEKFHDQLRAAPNFSGQATDGTATSGRVDATPTNDSTQFRDAATWR